MSTPIITRHEINELRDLARSSHLRHETKRVVVEGKRAIDGAIRAKANFISIFSTQDDMGYKQLCSDFRIVEQSVIDKISTTQSPQAMLAICEMQVFEYKQLESQPLIDMPIMVLDHVSDPGNTGTIIRSALAFSIGAIVLVSGCDPYHPKVVRSSAGSVFAMNIIRADDYELTQILGDRPLYSADLTAKRELAEITFENNAVVVFGNEANGIVSEFFNNKAGTFVINMAELCESLNVAMTATIVAHYMATVNRAGEIS